MSIVSFIPRLTAGRSLTARGTAALAARASSGRRARSRAEHRKQFNPRSPADVRQEIEEQKFLRGGGDATPPQPTTHEHTGAHE
jgi:hypothetical protein